MTPGRRGPEALRQPKTPGWEGGARRGPADGRGNSGPCSSASWEAASVSTALGSPASQPRGRPRRSVAEPGRPPRISRAPSARPGWLCRSSALHAGHPASTLSGFPRNRPLGGAPLPGASPPRRRPCASRAHGAPPLLPPPRPARSRGSCTRSLGARVPAFVSARGLTNPLHPQLRLRVYGNGRSPSSKQAH